MDVGDAVRLIPTEGGYQTPKLGAVTHVTAKHVVVQIEGSVRKITFKRNTGEPTGDAEFPRYRLQSASDKD